MNIGLRGWAVIAAGGPLTFVVREGRLDSKAEREPTKTTAERLILASSARQGNSASRARRPQAGRLSAQGAGLRLAKELVQLGENLGRVEESQGVQADGPGGVDIRRHIVDEHGL